NVCELVDPSCNSPRAGSPYRPEPTGKVTVSVYFGFEGVLQVTDHLDGGGVVTPALIQVTPPVYDNRTGPPALMVSPSTFDDVTVAAFKARADETLAHVFFRTNDCLDQPVSGIQVLADKQTTTTKPFYFSGVLPQADATETDSSGRGGIINLPPGGTVKLTA